MLTFGIRRLDNEVNEAAGNGDVSWRNGSSRDELFRLANDETPTVMRGLSDRQRIQHHRFFVHGAIAVLIHRAGTKYADVDLEAPIEHEVLIVNALDRDVVRGPLARRLIDFSSFDPGVDECLEPDAAQISGSAGGDGSIKTR